MIDSRVYHGFQLDIANAGSDRLCYILLPEGLKEDGLKFIDEAAAKYSVSIVVISGMDWNKALTPWTADGVFKKEKPFEGRADSFLKDLREDYFRSIEGLLHISKPERYLVGISLSGLFAVWSVYCCDLFCGIASISGSLWYDRFVEWVKGQTLSPALKKVFLSLGDREKKSKDARIAAVEEATRDVYDLLGEDIQKTFLLEEDTTHFSPFVPRLEKALDWLFGEPE